MWKEQKWALRKRKFAKGKFIVKDWPMQAVIWKRIAFGLAVLIPVGLLLGESEERYKSLLAQRIFDQLFDTTLPSLYKKGDWGIRIRPRMGDFLDDDYVRLLTGIRYSFSNYFDGYVDLGTYFMNPAQSGTGSGIYAWRLGGRYTWYNVSGSDNDVAAGINAEIPISDPPHEITDMYARYEPFVTISHPIRNHPNWRVYFNATYQFVDGATASPEPLSPRPRDRAFFRPGIIFHDGGKFRYSMELEYRTNALHFRDELAAPQGYAGPPEDALRPENWILAYEEVHELIAYPGITWFPSEAVLDGFILQGNWDVGLRLKLPVIEETGQDFGISVRFRWHFDYSSYLKNELRGLIGLR